MRYTTASGWTTEVRKRLFGKSTVVCHCGLWRTVPDRDAEQVANSHAASCRRN